MEVKDRGCGFTLLGFNPGSTVRIEAVSSSVPLFSSLENGAINSTELIELLWASNELSTKSSMH